MKPYLPHFALSFSTCLLFVHTLKCDPFCEHRYQYLQIDIYSKYLMAPSKVDLPHRPVEISDSPDDGPRVKDLVGPKEAFIGGPESYSKKAEEQGTSGQPPASYPHYLPIWDPSIK